MKLKCTSPSPFASSSPCSLLTHTRLLRSFDIYWCSNPHPNHRPWSHPLCEACLDNLFVNLRTRDQCSHICTGALSSAASSTPLLWRVHCRRCAGWHGLSLRWLRACRQSRPQAWRRHAWNSKPTQSSTSTVSTHRFTDFGSIPTKSQMPHCMIGGWTCWNYPSHERFEKVVVPPEKVARLRGPTSYYPLVN